jgi:hypothetical protein
MSAHTRAENSATLRLQILETPMYIIIRAITASVGGKNFATRESDSAGDKLNAALAAFAM